MPRSYPVGQRLRRPFLVTSYMAGTDGRLSAVIPAYCPQAQPGGPVCAITVDHHRDRTTGPKHPLAVARCSTHGCGFTLYPPGFAPYGRQPVLKLAPDGSPIQSRDVGLHRDFADTIFDAALEGAAGEAWARDSDHAIPDRYWGTQERHLKLTSRMVGIASDLADPVRESIAAVLSVSGLMQRERSSAKGYRAIGKAVCDVLKKLRGGHACRAFALLVCGHLAGLWGEPVRWDAVREDVEHSPFCSPGTASVP